MAPTFVARDDLRKKVWVTFNLIFQLLAQSQSVFLVLCEQAGNKLRQRVSYSNPRSKSAGGGGVSLWFVFEVFEYGIKDTVNREGVVIVKVVVCVCLSMYNLCP